MAIVRIELPHHSYDIHIEPGLLSQVGSMTKGVAPHRDAALFSDTNVAALYELQAGESLAEAGYDITTHAVPPGEGHKTLDTVRSLYDILLAKNFERKSPILALGGGVIGDTVGFVAASYLRGVPFVQVPTTLLAMVDSSVGGKTGVNVPQGKNLIGAFHQPVIVIIDPTVLQSLPPRELHCGLGECIKHGVIRDATLFEFIEQNINAILALDMDVLVQLVERNVRIKASVVQEDEREAGVRAHLNFGHTFAHAIEATAGYGNILHGEAVSLGMIAAARLAVRLKLCDASLPDRIANLCDAANLPTSADLPDTDVLLDAMKLDKKVQDSRIRFVLPTQLGKVIIHEDAPAEAVREAWESIRTN